MNINNIEYGWSNKYILEEITKITFSCRISVKLYAHWNYSVRFLPLSFEFHDRCCAVSCPSYGHFKYFDNMASLDDDSFYEIKSRFVDTVQKSEWVPLSLTLVEYPQGEYLKIFQYNLIVFSLCDYVKISCLINMLGVFLKNIVSLN